MKLSMKKIRDLITYHKNNLCLNDWSYTIQTNVIMKNSIAEVSFDIPYRKFHISFSKECEDLSKEDLIKTIIHEMIHMKLGITQSKFNDALKKISYEFEEQLVDDITWWYYGKK
jgi:hypothetical protein